MTPAEANAQLITEEMANKRRRRAESIPITGVNGEALGQRAIGLPAITRITRQAVKATTTTNTAQLVGISKATKGRPITIIVLNKAGKVNSL